MAESDQTIRDIVAQLVASQQQPPADAVPAMGSAMTMPIPARSNFAIMPFTQPAESAFPPPVSSNSAAAERELNLTPQEQALYARHLTNLIGPGGVDNPDGSRSTLYQAVQQHAGKFYAVPTVWNGRREVEPYTRSDGTVMDVPNATALANVSKAGWDSFPAYATPEEADARYGQMHDYMERDTADYMKQRGQ